MVQPGDAIGLRRSTGRFLGIEAQVMVIAAGRDEQAVTGGSPSRHATRLQYDVEAQHVHVEGTWPMVMFGWIRSGARAAGTMVP